MEKSSIERIVEDSPCLSDACLARLIIHTESVLYLRSEHEDLRGKEHRLGWYECNENRCDLRTRIMWPRDKIKQVKETLGDYFPSHMLQTDYPHQTHTDITLNFP